MVPAHAAKDALLEGYVQHWFFFLLLVSCRVRSDLQTSLLLQSHYALAVAIRTQDPAGKRSTPTATANSVAALLEL